MSKPLPEHVTRAEVAKVLRLSLRQVDRLAKAGALKKKKLSAARSGFDREDFNQYLKSAGRGDDYTSLLATLSLEFPVDSPFNINQAAEWLDGVLSEKLPGCLIKVRHEKIEISWNAQLGYAPEDIFNVV